MSLITPFPNDPLSQILFAGPIPPDLPPQEFPELCRTVVIDLVGPLADNRQQIALEKRTNTLLDRVNKLIQFANELDTQLLRANGIAAKDSIVGWKGNGAVGVGGNTLFDFFMRNYKIRTLADGTISAISKDAINGSQLDNVQNTLLPGYLHRTGTPVAPFAPFGPNYMTGDLYLGPLATAAGQKIKALAAGVTTFDAVNVGQLNAAIAAINAMFVHFVRRDGTQDFGDSPYVIDPGGYGASGLFISFNNKAIINLPPLGDAADATSGVDKSYVDRRMLFRDGAGSTPPGISTDVQRTMGDVLFMSMHRIRDVANPVVSSDAATAAYVDEHFHRGGEVTSPITNGEITPALPNRIYGDTYFDGDPATRGNGGGVIPHKLRGIAAPVGVEPDTATPSKWVRDFFVRRDGAGGAEPGVVPITGYELTTKIPQSIGINFNWNDCRIVNARDPSELQDYVTVNYLARRNKTVGLVSDFTAANYPVASANIGVGGPNTAGANNFEDLFTLPLEVGSWVIEFVVFVGVNYSGSAVIPRLRLDSAGNSGAFVCEFTPHLGGFSPRINDITMGTTTFTVPPFASGGNKAFNPAGTGTRCLVRVTGIADIILAGDIVCNYSGSAVDDNSANKDVLVKAGSWGRAQKVSFP